MTTVRLVADDLTGALDTAAEFVALTGPVHTFWQPMEASVLPPNAALDTATREGDLANARREAVAAVPALRHAGLAFKKVDSLMRGHTLAELAACYVAGGWQRAVLAPAFPFQGRVTRDGQQFMAAGGTWTPVGPDLVEALRSLDVPAHRGPRGGLVRGIAVCDAATDTELEGIVAAAGGADAPVLWCGTGGLAGALAGRVAQPPPDLPGPILGLFGSDQAATAVQLAACHPHWIALPDGTIASTECLLDRLDRHGIAAASHHLAPGLSRMEAADRIAATFSALVGHLPAPGTLIVAGGETLRGLCQALGATSLEVRGRIMPGVPVSILRGGRWDGVTIVSKSGAFGHPTLLRELFRLPALERAAS